VAASLESFSRDLRNASVRDVATALRSRRRLTPPMLGSNFDSQALKYVTIASSKPVEMDRFDIVLLIVYILLTSLVLRKRFVLQH
jgi:hypothetical protein